MFRYAETREKWGEIQVHGILTQYYNLYVSDDSKKLEADFAVLGKGSNNKRIVMARNVHFASKLGEVKVDELIIILSENHENLMETPRENSLFYEFIDYLMNILIPAKPATAEQVLLYYYWVPDRPY